VVVVQLLLQIVCIVVALALLVNPFTCPFMLAYMAWMYYDKRPMLGGLASPDASTSRVTPKRVGAGRPWVRRAKWWHYLRDYFPVQLIKTAELNPDRNYIFGYHPHGILRYAFVRFIFFLFFIYFYFYFISIFSPYFYLFIIFYFFLLFVLCSPVAWVRW
jgi:hypothetical protein